MPTERKTLQDKMLTALKDRKISCILFTTKGAQIHGFVKSYDSFTVLMEDSHRQQNLVYKHAISTISPSSFVRLDDQED